MVMKSPTYNQFRKVALLLFGMALGAWEVLVQRGRDPYVLVFLTMCLGFKPAVSLDTFIRKSGGLFTPEPTPSTEPDPIKEAAQ